METTERAMQRFNASSSLTKGYLICFTGTIFWSSTAIFISYLNNTYHLPSLVLAFWRDFFVVVALGVFFAITNRGRLRVERRHLKFFVLYGFVLSMFNASWTLSVGLNGAAVSTVLAYSSAAFTALLGWQLFSERLGPAKILAVSLSLVGCAFVSGAFIPSAWQVNPLGIITGLFSGLAFAAYSLMGKGAAQRKIDPWSTLLYTFGFGTLFLLAYNLIPGWLPSPKPVPGLFWLGGAFLGWVVLIILAIGPTIAGYGLYTVSMNYLPASVANLIATLEPVMTAILAYLLLGERMTPPQLFGGAMILGGVVLLRLSEGRAPSSPQETAVV